MSSESEQDEHLLESDTDDELQSLGSQFEDEEQGEEDSDSDLGHLEEDDEEYSGLIIDETQSTDEEGSSGDNNEEVEPKDNDNVDEEVESEGNEDDGEEVESENDAEEMTNDDKEMHSDDEAENRMFEHSGDEDGNKNIKDDDGNKSDLRLRILNKIKRRYENREGKTLYVRFPHRLPEDTAEVLKTLKDFYSKVSKIRRVRQRYARHCLVDFESLEDRQKGYEVLRKSQINGKNLVVGYPSFEQPGFFEKVTEKRLNTITDRRIRSKFKNLIKNKKEMGERDYTSTIIVNNIPPSAQLSDVKQLFPEAVDVKINFAKGNKETSIATVTMSTPKIATQVQKMKLKMNDNVLHLSFSRKKKPNLPKPEALSADEGNDSVLSQSSKKGKRKLEETTSEVSTPPKKNKLSKDKKSAPLQQDSGGPKTLDGTNEKRTQQKQNHQPEDEDPKSTPIKFKPQNANPNPKQTNFKPNTKNQNPNPKSNFKDEKQNKQKNSNAIKNELNKTVQQIIGSDDVSKEQKYKQNQKPRFPVAENAERQNQKSRFPIMKKNFQGKGVKTGKVFKNKQFKAK